MVKIKDEIIKKQDEFEDYDYVKDQPVFLSDIKRGSKIICEVKNDSGQVIGNTVTFHHLDGMYSYCTVDGVDENNVVHLSASQKLKKVGDYYKLYLD